MLKDCLLGSQLVVVPTLALILLAHESERGRLDGMEACQGMR
jgi:hypothetical protein